MAPFVGQHEYECVQIYKFELYTKNPEAPPSHLNPTRVSSADDQFTDLFEWGEHQGRVLLLYLGYFIDVLQGQLA